MSDVYESLKKLVEVRPEVIASVFCPYNDIKSVLMNFDEEEIIKREREYQELCDKYINHLGYVVSNDETKEEYLICHVSDVYKTSYIRYLTKNGNFEHDSIFAIEKTEGISFSPSRVVDFSAWEALIRK